MGSYSINKAFNALASTSVHLFRLSAHPGYFFKCQSSTTFMFLSKVNTSDVSKREGEVVGVTLR